MSNRLFLNRYAALALRLTLGLTFGLAFWWPLHAKADNAPASSSESSTAAAASPTGLPAYRSALDGYRAYADEKIVDWKAANDTTAEVGGWREYAREVSQALAAEAAVKPNSQALQTQPGKP